tara:strand:+ start:220 stop:798 length:579 start_codon:yes stop_codon:yes gene_type:complete
LEYLKHIKQFSILSNSELSFLDSLSKEKNYKKNKTLIKQGDVARDLIFLKSGIVASKYILKEKIFIRDFYFSPNVFTEQESFVKEIPAKFSVFSVTEIVCQTISHENLEVAYDEIPKLKDIAYDLLINGFVNISTRLESLLTLSPERRYKELLNNNPKLLQKIPLKLIASYLGVTDVALSRIRKRISVQKIS